MSLAGPLNRRWWPQILQAIPEVLAAGGGGGASTATGGCGDDGASAMGVGSGGGGSSAPCGDARGNRSSAALNAMGHASA